MQPHKATLGGTGLSQKWILLLQKEVKIVHHKSEETNQSSVVSVVVLVGGGRVRLDSKTTTMRQFLRVQIVQNQVKWSGRSVP